MPLEQSEPFHHSDRGERPHALLSNKQLNAKIEEIAEYADDDDPQASINLLNELIQEHYNRLAENKIEPSDDSNFTEYEVTNQPVDPEFQDFYMSDDVFEQAWGIAKMPLVRDSIESEDEDDFYRNRAVFQDRDDPSKQYPMETYYDQGGIGIRVRDPDNEGRLAARAYFNPYENRFSDVGTNEDYRRKGMMTAIYDLVNEIQGRRGRRLKSDAGYLSDSSAPFWAKALGLPYEGHEDFQIKHRGQGFEWPEEGVYE